MTKERVRELAAERGYAVATKPDSHDICFISDGDTRGFLAKRLGTAPGNIIDSEGEVVGEHEGAYAYTIGQRKGLRIGRPADDGKPRYVLDISPVDNTVTVGPRAALDVEQIVAERPLWLSEPPVEPYDCQVQLRAHGEVHDCTVEPDGEVLRIRLHRPAQGVAKGQAAVLYDQDVVLGSATIAAADRVFA
jgi:tRNA-specific 2-thiouridylase